MGQSRKKEARGRIRRAIAGAAPKIAGMLGGPLAGAAVEKLSELVFGDIVADEDALAQALETASPEVILALRKADQEFEVALRHAARAELEIAAGDRADARRRQVEMDDWTTSALGALIILGFFVVLGAIQGRVLRQPLLRAATDTLLIGGGAAALAYGVGTGLRGWLGTGAVA